MRTFLVTLLICASTALVFVGCDDQLVTEPYQSVSPEVALRDIGGIRNLALSTYGHLQDYSLYGRTLVLAGEMMSDNAESRPGSSRYQSHGVNSMRSHMGTVWGQAYQLINEANTVIDALENIDMDAPGVSQSEVDRLMGEMYFLRALAYHDLSRVFSYEPGASPGSGEGAGFDLGVIIRTEPTRGVEDADLRSRSSVSEVYSLIKNDLGQAISLLDGNDRGVFYGNHAAALALRARVALYERDWAGAITYADQAMAATGVDLVSTSDYASLALEDPDAGLLNSNIQGVSSIFEGNPNPESLFEVAILTQSEHPNNQNDALSSYLLPRQWHANVPPDDFLALFDEDDVRRLLYPFDDVEHGYPYTLKFNETNGTFIDNIPVIRYPELLLIKAEAHAERNEVGDGLDYLNELREARNAPELSTGNQNTLIDYIMTERRLEYAFEGHRWFDLKRRGMNITKPGGSVGVPYTDIRILANLPTREVNLNPNLVQNPGY